VVLAVAPLLLLPRLEWMPAALLVPGVWILSFCVSRRFVPTTPLNVLLLPLLIMVLVSTWATFDIEFSLGKVAGTMLGIFLLLALVDWADRWSRFWWLAAGFGSLGALFALMALLITPFRAKLPVIGSLVAWLPSRIALPVPEGSLNANPVGGTLVLFLPLLALVGFDLVKSKPNLPRRPGWGWLALAAGFLCLAVLALTQSRAAWVGFGAAVIFLLGFRYRWVRWAAAIGIVAGVVGLFLWAPWSDPAGEEAVGELGNEIGLASRFEIWNRAVYGIQDFPFTGMGMNAFRKVVHILYPLFLISPDTDIASAHNQWLQTALDLGIPGLVAYLGIWVAVGRMLWQVGRHSSNGTVRALALGLGAGLTAQMVFMTADAIPLGAKLGGVWWLAVALVTVSYRLSRGPSDLGRWRLAEIFLSWILLSLVAISFVGDYPYLSLGIALLGGFYLGYLAVPAGHVPSPQLESGPHEVTEQPEPGI